MVKNIKNESKIKLRVDDIVIVNSGVDAGKKGKILKVLRADNKVVVEGVNMIKTPTIKLDDALKIAKKNPKTYEVIKGDGFTNIVRNARSNGRFMKRVQSFDVNGNLVGTDRMVNCNYRIYSNPSSGLFGLQYFTKTNNPNKIGGFDLNRVYVETHPKNTEQIKAFLESQTHITK